MNIRKVKEIAQQRDIRVNSMKKGEIIRAIQSKEGNTACFDSWNAHECSQLDCLWRDDCK